MASMRVTIRCKCGRLQASVTSLALSPFLNSGDLPFPWSYDKSTVTRYNRACTPNAQPRGKGDTLKPVPLLDLRAQFAPLRDEIDSAIREIVEAQAFVLGPTVEKLEQEVARYVGAKHAVGCASGTDALILSLAAAGVGEGDEVLTSPFSFFSSASCAYKVGARPAFADIDSDGDQDLFLGISYGIIVYYENTEY